MGCPCEARTSTCRSFATISSGLYRFLAITVLLDVKDIHGRSVIWLTAARDSKLMFGALIHAAERWRGLRFTEFELRQIAAIRDDLDAEYDAKVTRSGRSSQPRFSSKSVP